MKRRDFFKFAAAPALAPIVIGLATEQPRAAAIEPTDLEWHAQDGDEITAALLLMGVDGSVVARQQIVGRWRREADGDVLMGNRAYTFQSVGGAVLINAFEVELPLIPEKRGRREFGLTTPCGGDITLQFPDNRILIVR